MKILVSLLLLFTTAAYTYDDSMFELEEIRIDYMQFRPGSRDPLINQLPNRELGNLLDLNITTSLFKYGYWKSLVHSYTDQYADSHSFGQYRVIGLNMEVGVRLTSFLDVFAWHYSQHTLDNVSYPGGFPVQDAYGIHIYLLDKNKHNTIFNF